METADLSKRFIRYWETSDWESFDNLLDENIELELFWLGIKIKKKTHFSKFFRNTSKIQPFQNLIISKTISYEQVAVIIGKSTRKIGIFGAPNYDLIEGYETENFEVCFLFKWHDAKLSKLYVKDVFVQSPEVVLEEMISQI